MIVIAPSILSPLFIACAALCLLPIVNPALALIGGMIFVQILGNPFTEKTKILPKTLLALSVMGLGAGMDFHVVAQAGVSGFGYTAISINFCIMTGLILGRVFKTGRQTSFLISTGTAICGGSAIAALAPAIGAGHSAIAVSLGIVFILNAAGLIIFPMIGYILDMSQHSFGLWIALAIHDTSSVVGAGLAYGDEALQTGTTVKLARALWIVPVVIILQRIYMASDKTAASSKKMNFPWFIVGFIAFAALVTYWPTLQPAGNIIADIARRVLVLTLFLIGANLNKEALKSVGWRPFAHGIMLWILVAVLSLIAIQTGLIA